MDIFIKWNNNKNSILLPINPDSFELQDTMNNTSVIVHNLGEINLKGKRNLSTISFSSFFPAQKYGFSHGGFVAPYKLVEQIKKLFVANETVHLIITQTDINNYFTIESFSHGESDGTGDVNFTIEFKEFRNISSSGAVNRVTKSATKNTAYVWKKGDTWPKVTKAKLGSSAKWKSVKKKNKAVITKAKKAYKKKHPKIKKINESAALVGYKVVIET